MLKGILIKQPNGKYCAVSYHGEVYNYNLTEQDIIDMYIKGAKSCMGNAKHYGNIIALTVDTNNGVSDDVLKEMGFNKTYKELLVSVPRSPLTMSYSGRDFTTYGYCPNCRSLVSDGIGGRDEKCKSCGQILKW